MEDCFEGEKVLAHLKRPQFRRAWGCLESDDHSEGPRVRTSWWGFYGKHRWRGQSWEGRETYATWGKEEQVKMWRNLKVLGLQSCYYVPAPKDLGSLELANAFCLGFSRESPNTREHCPVQPVCLPTPCDIIKRSSFSQFTDKTNLLITASLGKSLLMSWYHSIPTHGKAYMLKGTGVRQKSIMLGDIT